MSQKMEVPLTISIMLLQPNSESELHFLGLVLNILYTPCLVPDEKKKFLLYYYY
jgi:hypothetical protein